VLALPAKPTVWLLSSVILAATSLVSWLYFGLFQLTGFSDL